MSKVGRNQPCPCGSKLKYKYCCLSQHGGMQIREKTENRLDMDKQIIGKMIESRHERKMNEIIRRKTNGIVSKKSICSN